MSERRDRRRVVPSLVFGLLSSTTVFATSAIGQTPAPESAPEPTPKTNATPLYLPSVYADRANGKSKVSDEVSAAIARGLAWLAGHQDDDGRWDVDKFMNHDPKSDRCSGPGDAAADVAITGIALLAFLADGHSAKSGAYRATVTKGVRWLISQQEDSGEFVGRIGSANVTKGIYDHLFASLALLEAYGMSGDASLRPPAAAALKYITAHRHTDHGWHYNYRAQKQDTSVNVLAWFNLFTGTTLGIASDPSHGQAVRDWLKEVNDFGWYGYAARGSVSARASTEHAKKFPPDDVKAMTAAGAFAELLFGKRCVPRSDLSGSANILIGSMPKWQPNEGHVDLYYWVYGSLVMRQVGGDRWQRWSSALNCAVLAGQEKSGSASGSWPAVSVWSEDGGRVYATAMAVLCLEAEYRFASLDSLPPMPVGVPGFGRARSLWATGEFAGVAKEIAKLKAKPKDLNAVQKALIRKLEEELSKADARVNHEIEKLRDGPDFQAAKARLTEIRKSCKGMAAAQRAMEVLREFARSKKVRRELKAMTELERILKRPKDKQRILLDKLFKKHWGTYAAKRAQVLLGR